MERQVIHMTKPQDVYKKQNAMTASPIELIIMLFDGCRKFLLLGKKYMEEKNVTKANYNMLRAEAIVGELINSLDLSVSMSNDLMMLYEYMLRAMADANVKKDPEAIDPILKMVEELRETWKEVNDTQKGSLYMREAAQE